MPHIALNPGLSQYALWRDFHEKYPDKSPATYSCYHQKFRDDFSQAVSKYLRERRNLPARPEVTLMRRPEGHSEEHPAFSKDEWAVAVLKTGWNTKYLSLILYRIFVVAVISVHTRSQSDSQTPIITTSGVLPYRCPFRYSPSDLTPLLPSPLMPPPPSRPSPTLSPFAPILILDRTSLLSLLSLLLPLLLMTPPPFHHSPTLLPSAPTLTFGPDTFPLLHSSRFSSLLSLPSDSLPPTLHQVTTFRRCPIPHTWTPLIPSL
ncbi:uncharacterized protein EI90DRAFT_3132868 [Cantharellus anzutake]|uniref:uncharacterized protein n=1 Tax=Cantharellus anzutake TaxID=1750568 RepID=UPI0019082B2A|nr:uncharacterized protein EI90DRAFT_3132868 [Cantharellus anzutake]KAF8318896.1 hypothetical protein EI90DRAFT_3132868 [Cantharellus anzutake]